MSEVDKEVETDISELRPTERIVDILHPKTKLPIGVKVTVLSIDDDSLTKLKRKIQDRKAWLAQRGKILSAEEIEENGNALIFAAVTGWSWEPKANFHGEKPKFNKQNLLKIFSELKWFRDQLDEEIGTVESFFSE